MQKSPKKGRDSMQNKNENNFLILKRFCGNEKYTVKNPEWYIGKGDGTWDDPDMLCLEIEFGKAVEKHEDTAWYEGEPGWEIYFTTLQLTEKDLQPGFSMELENEEEEEEEEAWFLYADRQPTYDNKVEVLDVNGDNLLLHVTAKTQDVNYYDGSKPLNELDVTAWFTKQV